MLCFQSFVGICDLSFNLVRYVFIDDILFVTFFNSTFTDVFYSCHVFLRLKNSFLDFFYIYAAVRHVTSKLLRPAATVLFDCITCS